LVRFVSSALLIGIGGLIGSAAGQSVRTWVNSVSGAYAEPARWSSGDVPDSLNESARFDPFGTYAVNFEGASSFTPVDLEVVRGNLQWSVTSGAGDASLIALGDAKFTGGNTSLQRAGTEADVNLVVGDLLSLSGGAKLAVNQGADLIAGRTQIGAGTLTTPTELLISTATSAALGSTSIGESGSNAFEGLLTVTAGTQLSLGNLTIATTGLVNQQGAAQIVASTLTQASGTTTLIGTNTGVTSTSGLLAAVDGAIVELGPTTVRSTGRLRNIGGTFNFREGLIVDGGQYDEQAGLAAQRQLGAGQSIQAFNGAVLKFAETPLALGSSQQLVLNNSRVETLGGVAFSGGEVQATGGVSSLVGDLGAGATLRIAAGAELQLQGDFQGGAILGPGTVAFGGQVTLGAEPTRAMATAELRFTAESTLKLRLGGAARGAYDELSTSGGIVLGGGLEVSLLVPLSGPFEPQAGDRFTLFSGSALTGDFASLKLPALTSGLSWYLDRTPTTLTLVASPASLAGDYSHNGVVDAGDYTLWRDTLGQTIGSLAADGNSSGAIDAADLAFWRARFSTLSPQPIAATVPETNALLLTLLVLGLLHRRPDF
jgi:hypothetical protein